MNDNMFQFPLILGLMNCQGMHVFTAELVIHIIIVIDHVAGAIITFGCVHVSVRLSVGSR